MSRCGKIKISMAIDCMTVLSKYYCQRQTFLGPELLDRIHKIRREVAESTSMVFIRRGDGALKSLTCT